MIKIIREDDSKAPKKYIHKNPSQSQRFRNKHDYILSVKKSNRAGYYDVLIAKYGTLSYKAGMRGTSNYGFFEKEVLLSKEELKTYYNFDVTEYEKYNLVESVLTTPVKQKNFYISLGVDESDLSYYGKGKKLFPVIDLRSFQNERAGLSDFEYDFDETTTFYCMNLLSHISKKDSTYFFGYFGDTSGKMYEYGVVSDSIEKVYSVALDDYDYNNVLILGINFQQKRFINIDGSVHDDSVGFDEYFQGF